MKYHIIDEVKLKLSGVLTLVILLVGTPINVFSQRNFYTLEPSSKLPYSSALSLYQDTKGNVWIGSFVGAFCYDGVSFRHYFPSAEKSRSIIGNEIKSIIGDGASKVYLLSENGISVVDIYTNAIKSIPQKGISSIARGKDCIYVAIRNSIYALNEDYDLIHVYSFNFETNVTAMHETAEKTLWLGTDKSLYRLDKGTALGRLTDEDVTVTCISESQNHELWIGTKGDGIRVFDSSGKLLRNCSDSNVLPSKFIRSIVEDHEGNVCIGTSQGLTELSPDGKSTTYQNSPFDEYSLKDNSIYALLVDHQNSLWIGTYYGGAMYSNKAIDIFTYYPLYSFSEQKNWKSPIAGCLKAVGNDIYVGTEGDGLKVINEERKEFSSFNEKFGGLDYCNNIKSIFWDEKSERLWLGIHLNGLYYQGKNAEFIHCPIIINGTSNINTNTVNKIIDYRDSLLLATQNGVVVTDKRTMKSHFLMNVSKHQEAPLEIADIFLDQNERLWMAASKTQFCRYDLKSGRLVHYPELMNSTQILYHSDGSIFVTTKGNGVYRYDYENDRFFKCPSLVSYETKFVKSMASVSDSIILLTFQDGMLLYDIEKDHIVADLSILKHFPSMEPLPGCIDSNGKGEIYIGGKGGIIKMKPDKVYRPDTSSTLHFSRLFINKQEICPNKNSCLGQELDQTEKLELNYLENSLKITVVTNDFIHDYAIRKQYKLCGYDPDWKELGINNEIAYDNLPSGNYTLKVRIQDQPDTQIEMGVHISPVWYLSLYAILAYGIIILSLSVFIYHHIKTRHAYKRKMEEEKQLRIIHEQTIKFFTDVSHQFRTPLTLITAILEQVLNKKGLAEHTRKQIKNIASQTHRLKLLVNEVLDFAKHEENGIILNVYKIRLSPFLNKIYEDFIGYANQNEIKLILECDRYDETKAIWFDPVQMERALYNLLSNSLKYTSINGTVKLSGLYKEDHLEIAVEDNGCGIERQNLENIFKCFYRIDQQDDENVVKLGSGIGLYYTKSIIKAHSGKINVYSEPDKGSRFVICLPYGNEHFDKSCISADEKYLQADVSSNDGNMTENEDDLPLPKMDATVLLVDDNAEMLCILVDLFVSYFHVLKASNGKEAYELAQKEHPDIIITDILMPEMDGKELCTAIRNNVNTENIPIILLSDKTDVSDEISGLFHGADDYIYKPFNSQILLLKCTNLISADRRRKKEQELSQSQILTFGKDEHDQDFILKINAILEEYYSEESFDIEKLARELCMSRTALFNKCRMMIGQTPWEIILNYRFKKVKEILLENPNISVTELSVKVGFKTAKYFSTCFKNHFGVSVKEFKEKMNS